MKKIFVLYKNIIKNVKLVQNDNVKTNYFINIVKNNLQ